MQVVRGTSPRLKESHRTRRNDAEQPIDAPGRRGGPPGGRRRPGRRAQEDPRAAGQGHGVVRDELRLLPRSGRDRRRRGGGGAQPQAHQPGHRQAQGRRQAGPDLRHPGQGRPRDRHDRLHPPPRGGALGHRLPRGCAAQRRQGKEEVAVAAVGVTERLGASVPRAAAFAEAGGRHLSLASLSDRPLLLSFNYTGCPRLCGLQLSGIARGLRELGWRGEGFQVATVSIDPAEQLPQLLRMKQAMVRQAGGGPGVEGGWHFLKGAREDVDALAEAVGFRYRYDPRTSEYQHQATLVVLTGDGRVSGYLHGISYDPEALRAALERARSGRVASAEEQASLGGFLLTCMGFDPADPAPVALKAMRAGGVSAILLAIAFLALHLWRDRRRKRTHRDLETA